MLKTELRNTRVLVTISMFVILSLLSIYASSIIPLLTSKSEMSGNIGYVTSNLALLLLGPVFVIALSHDVVSREIETGTIRLIIPKIKRSSFIIGKFIGLNILFSLIVGIVFMICFVGLSLIISSLAENSSTALVMSVAALVILMVCGTGFKFELLKYLSPIWYGFIGFDGIFNPKAADLQIVKSIGGMLVLIASSFGSLIFIVNRRDF
jgi:ABC-type transport system involved in multi-copper enzyme maturation permease subunit